MCCGLRPAARSFGPEPAGGRGGEGIKALKSAGSRAGSEAGKSWKWEGAVIAVMGVVVALMGAIDAYFWVKDA